MATPRMTLEVEDHAGKERSLLQCLTAQILEGKMSVEDARGIVLRYVSKPVIKDRVPNTYEELRSIEYKMIHAAMKRNQNKVAIVAMDLGISAHSLYYRLKAMDYKIS